MAGWLNRATEAFRRKPPPSPEPFNVACDCGTFVTGVRTSAPQKLACGVCGRPVFILPKNIYPVSEKMIRRDEPVASPAQKSVESPASRVKSSEKPDRRKSNGAAPQQQPAGILDETRPPLLTPFRMVILAIVCVGGLGGWALWHRSRVEWAKANVLIAKEAGMKALAEHQFGAASRELKRARDAVDILRRTDDEAASIRRACREAIVGNELADLSLFEFLLTKTSGGQAQSLSIADRKSWMVFDTIVLLPEKDRPCVLDAAMEIEGRKFRIEIKSPKVRQAAEADGETQGRVIFAAHPSQIIADPQSPATFVLTLDGESVFLWSTYDVYSALGYRETNAAEIQATRDLLARQTTEEESK